MTGVRRPFQKFPVDPMLDYMMARAKASEGKSLKELKLQGHTSFKQVSIAMHNPTQIYTGVHNPTSCNPIIIIQL